MEANIIANIIRKPNPNTFEYYTESCIVTGASFPELPQIRMSFKQTKIRAGILELVVDDMLLTTPDATTLTLKTGYTAVLPVVPIPMAGCYLWTNMCARSASRARR
jgi:hypothetical protein